MSHLSQILHYTSLTQEQYFLDFVTPYGLWTSSVGRTWELVSIAESQVPLRFPQSDSIY